MSRYRKKPVVIDAMRWTGDNGKEMAAFMGRVEVEEGVWFQPFTPDPDFPAFQRCPNLP